MKTKENIPVRPELVKAFRQLCTNNREILLLSLCTSDGFDIKSFAAKSLNAEADKIAAMSSTISALSASSARQLLGSECDITTIETKGGNMILVVTKYLGIESVLSIATKPSMSLATARFTTKRMTGLIEAIKK